MSSSETKMDEVIGVRYVQVSEQESPGMLVPKKCDEQEKTDERQREADNGTGQPAKADNGTEQAAEADNKTGQPAEADNGTGQPAEGDKETGQPAEADNGTGQAAEADNKTGQPAEADNGTGQPAEGDKETGQPAEADNGTGQAAEADNKTGQPAEADSGTGQPAEGDKETGQPAEADNGTGQAAEADNKTGQPAEADNGTGQPAEGDKETGQPAEVDDGTGQPAAGNDGTVQPAEADNETGQPAKEKEADERLMIHVDEYNWPEQDEEFDGRNVVVIGINDSREAEYAFDWYMTILHRKEDLVVVVYALEIGQKQRLGLVSREDGNKETLRIADTQTALHDFYRSRFIDLKLEGAIVSRKGESGQLIIKEAKERRAAYIIIGKRNQDANLHHVVANSTSDFVVCNANCPVLVCKPDPNGRLKQRRPARPRTWPSDV